MRVLREASFNEVQQCFRQENSGTEGERRSESFDWTNERLEELRSAQWKYVLLSKSDILGITNPAHRHGWNLQERSTVLVAAQRLPREGECWNNVVSHRDRDFSRTHVFLKSEGNQLTHVDGFHRLLAFVVLDKEQEVPAYVAYP